MLIEKRKSCCNVSGLVSYLLQSGGLEDTFLKDFVSRLS
jgi:hypothetical protein